jgi:hypothetical protein
VIPGESKRDKKRREWVEKVQVKHLDRLENRDTCVVRPFVPLSISAIPARVPFEAAAWSRMRPSDRATAD